jgi:hypothetical protein
MSALEQQNSITASQPSLALAIFKAVSPEHQDLIREILREERDVQHLKRRADIHTRIYEHIRRLIK